MTGGVEGAECKEKGGFFILFLFYFLYHIFVVKVQEIAWSASNGENKTQNPKRTNKRNIRCQKVFNWGPYWSQANIWGRN